MTCNPRLHDLAQRVVGRDLVELKRSGALRMQGGAGGSTGEPCGGSRVYGLHARLAAGVAVMLDDPIAQRVSVVRRAAWSDGWIGHGSHSDRADERGGDWHRRRDAFDMKVGRPEGLRRRGLKNTILRGRGIGSLIAEGKSDGGTDEDGDEDYSEVAVEGGGSKGGDGEGGPKGRGGEGDVDDGGEDASGEGGASTILLAKFSSDTAEYDDTE